MTLRNLVWWLFILSAGLLLQACAPGTDLLVPGFLVALHERRPWPIVLVGILLILVQEGLGTLNFGGALLWYSAIAALYFGGRWLFAAENWLFILLLSGCIGAAHCGIFWLMARLQYLPVSRASLLDEGILQALLTPVVWQCALLTRRAMVRYDRTV